jgi:CHAT domain-containing protein
LNYLLEEYEISYAYSSTLLVQKQQPTRLHEVLYNYAGFAPSFDGTYSPQRGCNQEELENLICSAKGVAVIDSVLDGKIFVKQGATKETFVNQSMHYRILHLATHACVEDNDPLFNKIYFANNEFLSTHEICDLHVNADLAVLSACNTGGGLLKRGEGIMSLSRAFMQAGCPSIITSLWSVDDCATSALMTSFYKNIYKGENKAAALRNAKLSYLKEASNHESLPFYWAAFVNIGDTRAIELQSEWTNSPLMYLLLLMGIVIVAVLARIRLLK